MLTILFLITSLNFAANVEGSVTDPAGAKVAAARVTLRAASGVVVHQTRTDGGGRFSLSGVGEGRYEVAVEAAGFSQAEKVFVEVREGEPATANVRLEIAAISDHIIVSATRTEVSAEEFGASASVITEQDLKRANNSLVSEALRLTPGLAVAQTGGRGAITSIFSRGGESDYNKVLIDGVPVNAAGGLFDFAFLTAENVERVEVVRGPRSALFGSDAMTSVIQVVTRRGVTAVPELELSGEGGSFNYHRETARASGVAGWFDYSASFGFQDTDGRFQNSDYTNRSASANLGFRLAPSAGLRVTSRWNNNVLGIAGPTTALLEDPDQRQEHRDLALSAAFDLGTTSRWHHTARFIYSEFDTHSFDPAAQDLAIPGTPPPPFGTDFAFDFRNHQKRAGLHYQAIAALTDSHVLTGGIDYERESAVFTDPFSRVSPDRDNVGFYLQDQIDIRERLFLTAGIRVERNTGSVPDDLRAVLALLGSTAPGGDVGFGLSANPNLAVSAFVRRHKEDAGLGATKIKASFGTGIKEPQLDEAFGPSPFALGNPSLNPERAISFDVGAVQEFYGRRVSAEVTYFDNRFRDQIAFVFDPATFGPVRLSDGRLTNFVNLERASARGVELIFAARPVSKMRAAASYTFLRSRLERARETLAPTTGLPLERRPRHSGSFEVGWVGRRFDATLEGSLVGRRRDVDPVTAARFDLSGRPIFNDGYARLNASGSLHISRNVTAFARVENLLNQDYEEVLGFPAYRLNFSAGLRVRLGGGR